MPGADLFEYSLRGEHTHGLDCFSSDCDLGQITQSLGETSTLELDP